jgi:hypothetical protein
MRTANLPGVKRLSSRGKMLMCEHVDNVRSFFSLFYVYSLPDIECLPCS